MLFVQNWKQRYEYLWNLTRMRFVMYKLEKGSSSLSLPGNTYFAHLTHLKSYGNLLDRAVLCNLL